MEGLLEEPETTEDDCNDVGVEVVTGNDFKVESTGSDVAELTLADVVRVGEVDSDEEGEAEGDGDAVDDGDGLEDGVGDVLELGRINVRGTSVVNGSSI